jgi:hypothetical protein
MERIAGAGNDMKPKTVAVVLLLWALGAVTGASAQFGDADRFFGLEWTGGERRGRPNVNGYIVNNYRVRAGNLQLRVDSLDASGKPVATTGAYVPDVPAGGRVYFEVPVKEKAPRYRVTIVSWEWREASGQ